MTQNEFLEELGKVASQTQWNLYRGGELRTLNGCHCPITFVAWKTAGCGLNYEHPISAGMYIYLWEDDACDIIVAADSPLSLIHTDRCKELRRKLIEITKPLQTVDV